MTDKWEEIPRPYGDKVGAKTLGEDAIDDYVFFIVYSTDSKLDDIKLASDCASGVT